MALSILKDRYKTDAKSVSDRAFYGVVAGVLLFGFAVNAIEVLFFAQFFASWNPAVFTFFYVVIAIAGIVINAVSRNPYISFIGYCMVVLPIGAYLSLLLPGVALPALRSALVATSAISLAMLLLAILCPNFFQSLFRLLFVCLAVALVCQLTAVFTGFGNNSVFDWLAVLLFCGYIGFDVSLARNRPKTWDNAVDSACGLYLDIINLFVRLLIILLGKSR